MSSPNATTQPLGPLSNGRYHVVRWVGRGGMARVYLARDVLLDRQVALKVLAADRAGDGAFVHRFRREARAAAGLTHPNIVSVFDWGEAGSVYVIVMEYVDGRALSDLLGLRGPLPPGQAAAIGAQVAGALGYAHRHGIVHRDVKPGNILVSSDGVVKIADFGIAQAVNAEDRLTRVGSVEGTAAYLSPEQAQGRAVDPRSDLYSLGVVLHELVAGSPPFTGDTPLAVAYHHVQTPPTPLRAITPGVPEAFEAIVTRAMAKGPDDRFQSAEELRAQLVAFGRRQPARTAALPASPVRLPDPPAPGAGGDPVPTGAPTRGPRRRRLPAAVALVAAAAVCCAAVVGFTSTGGGASVRVPALVGRSLAQARALLAGERLHARVVRLADLLPAGIVYRQSPAAGVTVPSGATVVLDVSTGAVPAPTTAPTAPAAPPTTAAPATAAPAPTPSTPTTAPAPRPAPTTTLAPTTTAAPRTTSTPTTRSSTTSTSPPTTTSSPRTTTTTTRSPASTTRSSPTTGGPAPAPRPGHPRPPTHPTA